ncbi:MAG: rRNA processing protein RimM [Acidimicrobiaceae bacterium]|jgi:16S rRNA processing protein RimM|nr:rRNA processing protein RimM [Acidimicrobiaceae bacterium]
MTALEVGRIVKPHGIKGEVIVDLITDRSERVAAGSVLQSTRGPMAILQSSPHLGRWIVAFEGVLDRTAAEGLRGLVLSAEPIADAETLWIHELIGCAVVDTAGAALGAVVSVEANPASDLLVLDGGALIPLHFVVSHEPGRVTVDPPDGLFDL